MNWLTLISLAGSIAAALLLVPLVRALFRRLGFVDKPDEDRKLHNKPISLGGGLAVLAAVLVGFAGTILYDRYLGSGELGFLSMRWYGLIAATVAMLIVGMVDDIWLIRGRQKLLLQMLIISALVGSGTVVNRIGFFGFELHLGSLAFPVTVLWLLIAVNALNLIDGADGVATTTGLFISLGLGVLCFEMNRPLGSVFAFCLAGSLMGFLAFNRPPASIFLGDAGSMVIGLLVGVLSIWSSVKESTIIASAPIAVLAIPLFDSAAAIVRRWLTGRSIYATDRAHLHHLLEKKYGQRGMLVLVAVLCGSTTSLAVISATLDKPWLAFVGIAASATFLVVTRSFGHAECQLLLMKAQHMTRSFFITPQQSLIEKNHRCLSMQGNGDWKLVWEPLVEFAQDRQFSKVMIDLNLSWLHEGYHASWSAVRMPDRDLQLQVRWPLIVHVGQKQNRIKIGSLFVVARADRPDVHEHLSELSLWLADLEPQIQAVIGQLERQHGNVSVTTSKPMVPRFASTESARENAPLAHVDS
ncbi:MAG: MraY family glycosyltransferase [Planctomycetota bacterium]